jgi:hypothetical protein
MPHDPSIEKCIQSCTRCHRVCLEAINYCLIHGHIAPSHLRILLDCAEICATAANFVTRNSDVHRQVCTACAAACRACASSCMQYKDDAIMQACAQICLECADVCEQNSGHLA